MANVDFTREDWDRFCAGNSGGQHSSVFDDLWDDLNSITRRNALEDLMARASRLLDAPSVEAIRIEGAYVDNYYGAVVATYLNMGDTYNETLLLDSDSHTFYLTTYGDFVQQYEQEHPRLCPECGERPAEYNGDTGEYDLPCSTCADELDAREEEDVEEAERQIGRFFEVQIEGEVRTRRQAQWAVVHDEPELWVRFAEANWVIVPRASIHAGELRRPGDLRQAGDPDFWRLTRDSIGIALVELDLFLESF